MKQTNDAAIEQVRKVRHRISAAHEHDAEKLINYYIELQKVSLQIKKRENTERTSQTRNAEQINGGEGETATLL